MLIISQQSPAELCLLISDNEKVLLFGTKIVDVVILVEVVVVVMLVFIVVIVVTVLSVAVVAVLSVVVVVTTTGILSLPEPIYRAGFGVR